MPKPASGAAQESAVFSKRYKLYLVTIFVKAYHRLKQYWNSD